MKYHIFSLFLSVNVLIMNQKNEYFKIIFLLLFLGCYNTFLSQSSFMKAIVNKKEQMNDSAYYLKYKGQNEWYYNWNNNPYSFKINDSIYFEISFSLFSSENWNDKIKPTIDSVILVKKINVNTKEVVFQNIKVNYSNYDNYYITKWYVTKDIFNNFYFEFAISHRLYNYLNSVTITKFDTSFNEIWSKNFPNSKISGYDSMSYNYYYSKIRFIDTNIFYNLKQNDINKIVKLNSQGTILGAKKAHHKSIILPCENNTTFTSISFLDSSFIYSINKDFKIVKSLILENLHRNYSFFQELNNQYIQMSNGGDLYDKIYNKIYKIQIFNKNSKSLDSIHNFYNNKLCVNKNNSLILFKLNYYYYNGDFYYDNFNNYSIIKVDSNWEKIRDYKSYEFPKEINNYYEYFDSLLNRRIIYHTNYFIYNSHNYDDYYHIRFKNYNSDDYLLLKRNYLNPVEVIAYAKNGDFDSVFPFHKVPCDTLEIKVDTIDISSISEFNLDTSTSININNTFFSFNEGVKYSVNDTFLSFYNSTSPLSAFFILPKDTFCLEPINLIADTSAKMAINLWILQYKSDTIILNDIDKVNYNLIDTGKVIIKHIVSYFGCVDTFVDSIYVIDQEYSKLNLGNDTALCPPFLLTLNAKNIHNTNYLWNNNSIDTVLSIDTPGKYYLRITNICGVQSDTIQIKYTKNKLTQSIFETDSLILCKNQFPYILTSKINDSLYSYKWNNMDTTSKIEVDSSGVYSIFINDGCFKYFDTIIIVNKYVPELKSIPKTMELCNSKFTFYKIKDYILEEKINNLWVRRDSITLNKNKKIIYKWIDSCNNIYIDSIQDINSFQFKQYANHIKICDNYSTFIENYDSINQYEWINNSWFLNNKVKVNIGLNIIKRIDTCGNFKLDTIIGNYNNKKYKNIIKEDTILICYSNLPIQKFISDTFNSYLWSNGSIENVSTLSKNGIYTVIVKDLCYEYFDTLYLKVEDYYIPNLFADSLIYVCKSFNFINISSIYNIYSNFIWNNISSFQNIYLASTLDSIVELKIIRKCDTLKDQVKIIWKDPLIINPQVIIDSSYCKEVGKVKLELINPHDYYFYSWNSNVYENYVFVNSKQKNYIKLKNECNEKIFEIPSYSCPILPVGLPNSFSPNNDGINDFLELQGAKNIILHEFKIYNRWGEKIFESIDPHFKWDGIYKNQTSPIGVYIYILEYEYIPQKIRHERKGSISIFK